MKFLLALGILLGNCLFLVGQQQKQQQLVYPWSVRLNFTGLADPFDTNISAGAEYALNPRLSVATDLAYLFYSRYLPEDMNTKGVIIKPAIRYYTTDQHNWFVEAAPFYKYVGYTMKEWLGKDCVDGIPAYDQYQKFTFRKRVIGLNMQAGIQVVLSKDKALRMEFYAGLSIRKKWQDIKDDSRACFTGWQPFRITDDNSKYYQQVAPGFPGGIRLVYSFKRK